MTELLRKHNIFDNKILEAGVEAYRKTKPSFLKPYPGVIETLENLKNKGIKIGLISDAQEEKALERLEAIGVTHFFDSILTNAGKPNVEAFEKALEKLEVKPEEAIMVGDFPQKDILGAKRAGLKTAHAKYGFIHPSEYHAPDYELETVDELLKIVL